MPSLLLGAAGLLAMPMSAGSSGGGTIAWVETKGVSAARDSGVNQGNDSSSPAEQEGASSESRPDRPFMEITAAVHVHTTTSTGAYSLATLSSMARNEGIDAVVLGENLQLDFRYGPWPLRYFFELRRTRPSLLQRGTDRFLTEIEEVQATSPRPLLLPGVEVMPHYYWTGSLAASTLTLHNSQRNMLVVLPATGSGSAGDAAVDRGVEFLGGLPAIATPGGERHDWRSLAELLPGLALLGYGIYRILRRRSRGTFSLRGALRTLIGGDHPQLPMKEVAIRALLLVSGIYLLYHGYPYSQPAYSPYDPEIGLAPYQELIDSSWEKGGLVYWSMPEAADRRELGVGPVPVQLVTEPYPEVLAESVGYTGFGGVHASTITLLDAGGQWDSVLTSYCRGERSTAPWLIGETAFHYTGQARKRLSDVLTVLWVPDLTRENAFEAMSNGRGYALRQELPRSLRLREFTLDLPSTGRSAWPGDTLELPGEIDGASRGPIEFDLVVEMSAESNESIPVQVDIIRQGELIRRWEETTPFRRRVREALDSAEDHVYYRVAARGPRPLQVASNPIFVRRQ